MVTALTGPVACAASLSHQYAQLANTVADGASHCHRIVECVTLDPFRGREMSAALEYRLGCIGDLAASLGWPGGPASECSSSGGEVSCPASGTVAAALCELNISFARATCVLEEGTRLRQAQHAIVADIQANLRRTERQVCCLAEDTNALAQRIAGVVAAR